MVVRWWKRGIAVSPRFPLTQDVYIRQSSSRLRPLAIASFEFFDARSYFPGNSHFVPLPGSRPLPLWAAILPPFTYFLAIALLPPFQRSYRVTRYMTGTLKFILATISILSFAVLPIRYHVPGSAVFTYQLALIGCLGAGRAFDIFFLSYPRVPRRLARIDVQKAKPSGRICLNHSISIDPPTKSHPCGLAARLWWALDLMTSMRGIGWDFASPDLRLDSNPWHSPSRRQLRRTLLKIGPVLALTMLVLRKLIKEIALHPSLLGHRVDVTESASLLRLPSVLRPLLVACTGLSLYIMFDLGYTIMAAVALPLLHRAAPLILCGSESPGTPLNPQEVGFSPLLKPINLTAISSVRSFWSKAWHRLFHRTFLIYGIIPGCHAALHIEFGVQCVNAWVKGRSTPPHPFDKPPFGMATPSKYADPGRALRRGQGDWGKVLGAFFASGVLHGIAERAILGGRVALPAPDLSSGKWSLTRIIPNISGAGQFGFFLLNGLAVIVETAFGRAVMDYRRNRGVNPSKKGDGDETDSLARWYDVYFQLAWTLAVLLSTGELFVESWIASGLIAEITMS